MPNTSYRKPATRKAATPEQQLAHALDLAHQKGLKVAFAGADFWAVPSDSESLKGLYHIVRKVGAHLFCECLYSQNTKRICAHRACVYEYLKDQASQKQQEAPLAAPLPVGELAKRAEAAQPVKVSPDFQKKLDSTIFPAQPDRASLTPAQRRENALPADHVPETFSIFKAETPAERRYQTLEDEYAARDGAPSGIYASHAYR